MKNIKLKSINAVITSLLMSGWLSPAFADSAQLTMLKSQLHQLEQSGAKVPPSMYQMVKQLEDMEAKDKTSNSNKPASLSCSQDISGTWYSSAHDQKVVLNRNGSGNFEQTSVAGQRYKSEVSYNWSASMNNITFNYISEMKYTNLDTNKVEYKGKPKSGTVSCQFADTVLNIGGVPYYR